MGVTQLPGPEVAVGQSGAGDPSDLSLNPHPRGPTVGVRAVPLFASCYLQGTEVYEGEVLAQGRTARRSVGSWAWVGGSAVSVTPSGL